MTSVNFVLKIAEAGSSRVVLAGGASFVKVNRKDWEGGQSIRAREVRMSKVATLLPRARMLCPTSGPNLFPLAFTKDSPPARATRELPAF